MQKQSKKIEFKQTQIFNHTANYLSLLQTQQNTLQAYRQALTTRTDFHPLALFNYITRGEGSISRRNILMLLEENNFEQNEEQIKVLFGLYGYKDKIDFAGFLNYIYPSSIEPLKYISTVGLKKYSGIPLQEGVNQQIVCLTILLLIKEIEYIQQLQIFKQDYLPKLTKNQIKKIIKLIKKKGQSKSVYDIQSQSVVTFSEMRICLRKSKNMQENKINSICRKLSMSKDNFISLEQFEFWLRPWNRIRNQGDTNEKENPNKTLLQDFYTTVMA